jgi:phosphoserine aminotransferase
MDSVYNFSAGPATLPASVLRQAQAELLSYGNAKASVMEISHRGKDFMQLANKAQQDLRDLMSISDDYQILFLQGGGSSQFSMVPINLLRGKKNANYLNTGHWAAKAIAEAKRYCSVNVCTDSSQNNYTDIEDFSRWSIDEKAAYLHYVSNETIAGLALDFVPELDMPIVADMSSDILSAPVDVSKFGVIYAGAQKNIGVAGLTIVIVRKDLLGRAMPNQPTLFDWQIQANNDSMYNTPTTFAWYMAARVFEWLKEQGGVEAIAKINLRKANKLYTAIDTSGFYSNLVSKKYRSKMNIPFVLADSGLDALFLERSFKANLLALKGHKSVGGMRASIYNAMPEEGVDALIEFMKDFERQYG